MEINSIGRTEAGASFAKFGKANMNVALGVIIPDLVLAASLNPIDTLNNTGQLISPEFDHFFASQVFPLMVEKTPVLAREFLNLLENMATDDALLTKTTTLTVALFAGGITAYFTGIASNVVAYIQHRRDMNSVQLAK